MKLKALLLLAFASVLVGNINSNPNGAPSDGRTGSPGDGGKTCATGGCHNGTATDVAGFISSNVPAEGYTPGTDYTITVTVDQSGNKGFVVSPQKQDGSLLGTLTAGAGNQMVGTKYITHTAPKTGASAVWTFTWKAPASGTGNVDFYGAFANNRSLVRKTKYTIAEKVASGVNENTMVSKLSLYPNPAVNDEINIGFQLRKDAMVSISLIDITGKTAAQLFSGNQDAGNFEQRFALPALQKGIYFVRIETGNEVMNKRVLVQ